MAFEYALWNVTDDLPAVYAYCELWRVKGGKA